MMTFYILYFASYLLAIATAYPTYYDARNRDYLPDNIGRDFNLWPRPEPAPLYGYPDYGDYGNPRPAYTELDIVREQLAHSPQSLPFIKRYPSLQPSSYDEPEDDEYNNWLDNEIPPNDQSQIIANNPQLKTLTEALLQALILEKERQEREDSLIVPEYSQVDNDEVVQQLKATAVKKSAPSPPTVADIDATAVTSNNENGHSGQKEIPLLRPPNRPTPPVATYKEGDKKLNTGITQQKTGNGRRFSKKNLQRSTLVATTDDLTKELSNLKKMSQ